MALYVEPRPSLKTQERSSRSILSFYIILVHYNLQCTWSEHVKNAAWKKKKKKKKKKKERPFWPLKTCALRRLIYAVLFLKHTFTRSILGQSFPDGSGARQDHLTGLNSPVKVNERWLASAHNSWQQHKQCNKQYFEQRQKEKIEIILARKKKRSKFCKIISQECPWLHELQPCCPSIELCLLAPDKGKQVEMSKPRHGAMTYTQTLGHIPHPSLPTYPPKHTCARASTRTPTYAPTQTYKHTLSIIMISLSYRKLLCDDPHHSPHSQTLAPCHCWTKIDAKSLACTNRQETASLRFQASGDAEIKTVPRHFARANQADRCITLLHCAQRLTPWLLDTRGCERKVECFSLFERYVTLPVGTWLIALDQSFRSHYDRLLRTSQSHYFVLWGKRNKLFR